MICLLGSLFRRWRQRRYRKKHPVPHRDPLIPRKRSWCDPVDGPAAFMPPPSRATYVASGRPRRSRDDDPPPSGGHPVRPAPVRWRGSPAAPHTPSA